MARENSDADLSGMPQDVHSFPCSEDGDGLSPSSEESLCDVEPDHEKESAYSVHTEQETIRSAVASLENGSWNSSSWLFYNMHQV